MEIKEIEVKSVMTKSNLPVCDFSVNPYVGCTHACKYCYAEKNSSGKQGFAAETPSNCTNAVCHRAVLKKNGPMALR